MIALYRDTATEMRLPDGTEHIGYPIRVFVADSQDKAQAEGHNFFWQNGAFNKQPREWMAPQVMFPSISRASAVCEWWALPTR